MSRTRRAKEKLSNSSLVSRFIVELKFEDLPEEVIYKAKRCLLDFLGVALASENLPAFACGRGLLDAFGQSEEATVIGSGERVPLISAIWANTLLGSIMDLEDGYYPSIGHPASVIFPVILAFAERERASTHEFLTASIIGYEVCARSGAAMTRFYRKRSLGSGSSSVYGSAAAASRLLRLDWKGVESALGIAGAYMPSTPVHRSIEHETMVKGGIPWGAFVGASSALLARRGFTGPPATMQDPFADENDESACPIFKTLGKKYEILNVYFKKYPSCRWTHAPLDATLAILQEQRIEPSQVETVLVETFEEALTLNHYRPSSLEGLQFSIPFTVALAILEGEFGVKQMSIEYLQNPDVIKTVDKVKLALDPTLDRMFPEKRPARVTITTDEGRSFTREVLEVHGEPGSDFAAQGVREKFFDLASSRLGRQKAGRIYEIVESLESLPNLNDLIGLLQD